MSNEQFVFWKMLQMIMFRNFGHFHNQELLILYIVTPIIIIQFKPKTCHLIVEYTKVNTLKSTSPSRKSDMKIIAGKSCFVWKAMF